MEEENGNEAKHQPNRVWPMGNVRPLPRPRTPAYQLKTQRPDATGRAPK